VLCLTATATPAVAADICRAFDIEADTGMFRATSYRSKSVYSCNPCFRVLTARRSLHLSIVSVDEDPEGKARAALAAAHLRAHPGPSIVYITTQANTEAVAAQLVAAGVPARAYHAGLDPAQRKAAQEWFMASPTAVVCATSAPPARSLCAC
jgi:superfamily II DNA helicase RecQ